MPETEEAPEWRTYEREEVGDWLVLYDESPEAQMTTKVQVAIVYEKEHADLLVAAGTAASELPPEYDPENAVRALPELIEALEDLRGLNEAFSHDDLADAIDDVLQKARGND